MPVMVQKSHHVGNFHWNMLAICHYLFPATLARACLPQGLQFPLHTTRLSFLSLAISLPLLRFVSLHPHVPLFLSSHLSLSVTCHPSDHLRQYLYWRETPSQTACSGRIPEPEAPSYHYPHLLIDWVEKLRPKEVK